MRHFVGVDLELASPLSVPRLPGCVAQTPATAPLIPPNGLPRPLPARLHRADTTAVALPAVTGRADRNLTVAPWTDQQPVVRTRPIPRLAKGELDGDQNRGDTGGRNAVATPCFGGPGGSDRSSLRPPGSSPPLGSSGSELVAEADGKVHTAVSEGGCRPARSRPPRAAPTPHRAARPPPSSAQQPPPAHRGRPPWPAG